jgi:hypothetical protein
VQYLAGKNLNGYITNGLLEVHNLRLRHNNIAEYMERRKYNHSSPLPEFEERISGKIDSDKSLKDLSERCEKCRLLNKILH